MHYGSPIHVTAGGGGGSGETRLSCVRHSVGLSVISVHRIDRSVLLSVPWCSLVARVIRCDAPVQHSDQPPLLFLVEQTTVGPAC